MKCFYFWSIFLQPWANTSLLSLAVLKRTLNFITSHYLAVVSMVMFLVVINIVAERLSISCTNDPTADTALRKFTTDPINNTLEIDSGMGDEIGTISCSPNDNCSQTGVGESTFEGFCLGRCIVQNINAVDIGRKNIWYVALAQVTFAVFVVACCTIYFRIFLHSNKVSTLQKINRVSKTETTFKLIASFL